MYAQSVVTQQLVFFATVKPLLVLLREHEKRAHFVGKVLS